MKSIPANRMARFEFFIGVWNTTGEVLETDAMPAGTLVATDTCAQRCPSAASELER